MYLTSRRQIFGNFFLLLIVFTSLCKSILQKPSSVVHLKEEHPEGIWKSKMQWKAHWVKHWETRTVWVPIWRKVWGPVETKEWVPLPKQPPTWIPPLH